MGRILSQVLTTVTVLVLVAIVVLMALEPSLQARWMFLFWPLVWTCCALVALRLILTASQIKTRTVAPIVDSVGVYSAFYGFTPGTSHTDESGRLAYSTSLVEDHSEPEPGVAPRHSKLDGPTTP